MFTENHLSRDARPEKLSGRDGGSVPADRVPRFFCCRRETDLFILDVERDQYLWRELGETIDLSDLGDDSIAAQEIISPDADTREQMELRSGDVSLLLVAEAALALCWASVLCQRGFSPLAQKVNKKLSRLPSPCDQPIDEKLVVSISLALQLARMILPFSIRCLPNSVAAALLARRHGLPANLIIGVVGLPFQAHAWAQVGRTVINDRIARVRFFAPIARFPL